MCSRSDMVVSPSDMKPDNIFTCRFYELVLLSSGLRPDIPLKLSDMMPDTTLLYR